MKGFISRLPALAGFGAFYLWTLLRSNLRVAYDTATPRHHMRPGVVAMPLAIHGDFGLLLLSNLISMTPGSLSLDVSPERDRLFVHMMYIDDVDEARRSLKDLERRVKEAFGV